MTVLKLTLASKYTDNYGERATDYLSNGEEVELQGSDMVGPNTIPVEQGILIITMNAVLETYDENNPRLGIKFEAFVGSVSAENQIFDPYTHTLYSESENDQFAPDMHNLSTTKIIKINNDTDIIFKLTMIGNHFTFNSSTSSGTPLTAPDGDSVGAGAGTEGAARQPFIEINCLNL